MSESRRKHRSEKEKRTEEGENERRARVVKHQPADRTHHDRLKMRVENVVAFATPSCVVGRHRHVSRTTVSLSVQGRRTRRRRHSGHVVVWGVNDATFSLSLFASRFYLFYFTIKKDSQKRRMTAKYWLPAKNYVNIYIVTLYSYEHILSNLMYDIYKRISLYKVSSFNFARF